MTTNLPSETAMAMVVLASAAVEMMVVGSKRRVWMGRRLQLLWRNDTTDPQKNRQQGPAVVPAATATDHPVEKPDNSGATKTTTTMTNVGPWQQGQDAGGHNDGGNNAPPSPPCPH
jgi:hypothetical protein